MLSWDTSMLRTPLTWSSIKQEPIDNTMVNTFVPNNSEGFRSSSPSSSSRGSPPASSPPFRSLTPHGFQQSPETLKESHQVSSVVTPPKSPSISPPWNNTSDGVPSPGGDSLPDGDDEPGLRMPAVNSHGKVKTFKCKQCEFMAVTKMDFWDHTKTHIKPERMLKCPKCPFVTEYKHHLEYHMRNHMGSKPFQCTKCSYSCVNKSMLNSHLKSHSNVYQYRCNDCNYATKYCHSLKLHLRKYTHHPAMVLNQDGTPNPLPIIDVYGTRRGPKQKSHPKEEVFNNNNHHPIFGPQYGMNFPYGAMLHPSMFIANNNNITDPLLQKTEEQRGFRQKEDELALRQMQNLSPHLQVMQQRFFSEMSQSHQNSIPFSQTSPNPPSRSLSPSSPRPASSSPRANQHYETPGDALDLTNSSKQEMSLTLPITPTTSLKNRRKGRAFKLDRSIPRIEQANDSMDTDDVSALMNKIEPENVEVKVDLSDATYECIRENVEAEKMKLNNESIAVAADSQTADQTKENSQTTNNNKENSQTAEYTKEKSYDCQFCHIAFKDIVMYTMHMGYHGYEEPFKCNMCGEVSEDRVSFFVHIARKSHT